MASHGRRPSETVGSARDSASDSAPAPGRPAQVRIDDTDPKLEKNHLGPLDRDQKIVVATWRPGRRYRRYIRSWLRLSRSGRETSHRGRVTGRRTQAQPGGLRSDRRASDGAVTVQLEGGHGSMVQ
jgi:hypothetical protein